MITYTVTVIYTVKIQDDGTKKWYLNGKLHREDGPAVEWADGTKEWYLNGKKYSEKKFNQLKNQSCNGKMVTISLKKYKLIEQ